MGLFRRKRQDTPKTVDLFGVENALEAWREMHPNASEQEVHDEESRLRIAFQFRDGDDELPDVIQPEVEVSLEDLERRYGEE